MALPLDLTKPDSVYEVVEKILNHFGQIDILVNNSGASWGAPYLSKCRMKHG